MKLKKMSFE